VALALLGPLTGLAANRRVGGWLFLAATPGQPAASTTMYRYRVSGPIAHVGPRTLEAGVSGHALAARCPWPGPGAGR
jgi:hypothetical protein